MRLTAARRSPVQNKWFDHVDGVWRNWRNWRNWWRPVSHSTDAALKPFQHGFQFFGAFSRHVSKTSASG